MTKVPVIACALYEYVNSLHCQKFTCMQIMISIYQCILGFGYSSGPHIRLCVIAFLGLSILYTRQICNAIKRFKCIGCSWHAVWFMNHLSNHIQHVKFNRHSHHDSYTLYKRCRKVHWVHYFFLWAGGDTSVKTVAICRLTNSGEYHWWCS